MLLLLSHRRALLNAVWALLLSNQHNVQTSTITLKQAAQLICSDTPRVFRQAVQASGGKFLYRGAHDATPTITVDRSKPDLLLPNTYNDPSALLYFQCLERQLDSSTIARPSTGHIGTADPSEAALWGNVVSVWPLGSQLSFIWPSDRKNLFPGSCPDRNLMVDNALEDALEHQKEVLFASWNPGNEDSVAFSFLSIPSNLDAWLKLNLDQSNYGL